MEQNLRFGQTLGRLVRNKVGPVEEILVYRTRAITSLVEIGLGWLPKLGVDMSPSMTQLLSHIGAHYTGPSFML